ncbi:MAG TPA: tetratricopeptide repeat protein [Terracidiphilus sp.]|nr:tetratricopeptide repeat protein [Terracidiphilus sp.]
MNAIVFAEAPAQTVQSLVAEARAAQSKGDLRTAAEAYRKATGLEPSVPELWANLGLMYHEMGSFDEAIKSFTEAARLNPSLYVPQLFMGIDYLKLKRTETAIPFLEKAEKLSPADPQAPIELGRAFAIAGSANASSDAYWRAANLAPGNGKVWFGLGMAYLQQVDSDARVLTSTYKDSNTSKLRAGELMAEQGKLLQAARDYQDALSGPSPLSCSHAGYGIVLLREKAIAEAKAEFDRESSSNPGCPLTRVGFAALQLVQDDTGNALKELTAIWNADADFLRGSLPLLRDAITTEQGKKLFDLAKQWQANNQIPSGFVDAIQAGLGSDAPVAAVLTRVKADPPELRKEAMPPLSTDPEKFYLSGHFRECSETLRPRLSVLPERHLSLLAQCAFYTGDYRTASLAARRLAMAATTRQIGLYWESKADQRLAIAALTRAGEIDANSPGMHVLLGDAYRQRRSWEGAVTEYRKALVLEPDNRSGRLGLAISLYEDGKSEEALASDKELLLKNPEDPEANLLAGEVFVRHQQYADAEPYLKKSRDVQPEFMPRLHALLGDVYANMGRDSEALSEFKIAMTSDEDGSIHYQMARLYQKTGDKKAAAEAFQTSRQLREKWDASASFAPQQPSTDISRQ